jgi:hypothetical protein
MGFKVVAISVVRMQAIFAIKATKKAIKGNIFPIHEL